MSNIIVALIGAGGSCIGAVLGIFANTKLINYRIEQLEEKVNKHNNLVDRTYKLESKEQVIEEHIKAINNKIEDIEKCQTIYSDNKYVREH